MGKKLSILFVTYEYPNKNGIGGGGGIATVYHELSKGLAKKGNDVWVLTHSKDEEEFYVENNVVVWRIKIDPNMNGDKVSQARGRSMAVKKAISSLLQRRHFDIIQFPEYNGEGYDFIKAREKVTKMDSPKIVVRLHSSTKPYKKSKGTMTKSDRLIMEMEKSMLTHCDLVISPCKATWKAVKSSMNLHHLPVTYIPNSINSDLFSPAAKHEAAQFVFGYVGKLTQKKGLDTIIAAFSTVAKRMEHIQIQLIGSDDWSHTKYGSLAEWVAHEVPEFIRKRVSIVNYTPRYELINYYRNFDVFVFASRYENFPNTLVEAMSCGLPVIASEVGGVPELLGKNNPSLRFKAGDHDKLADAMYKIVKDSELRKKSGIYNRQRIIKHFTTEEIAKRCKQVYQQLANKK